jgi:hypothetical protein
MLSHEFSTFVLLLWVEDKTYQETIEPIVTNCGSGSIVSLEIYGSIAG